MTALADKVADEGYDAVFLMGVGGTWDELMQLEYLMNKFGDRDLEVYLIHAAEWNAMGHKRMTEKSVVLTASESGTTPEVLEAVKKMKGMGVRVYAMTKPEGPIGQAVGAENCVAMASDHGSGGCEKGYYLADCFGLRLLNRRGCFPSSICLSSRPRISGRTCSTSASASSRAPRSSPRSMPWPPTPCSSAPAPCGARPSCSRCASSRRCSGSAPATSPRPTSSTALSSSWSPASRSSCSWARTRTASSTSASAPS
ncbi:MAG: hypothetical protein ACLU0O_12700 [Collinsella sp.]